MRTNYEGPGFLFLLCPLLAYTESLTNVEDNNFSSSTVNTGVPTPESQTGALDNKLLHVRWMSLSEFRLSVEFLSIGVFLYHFPLQN